MHGAFSGKRTWNDARSIALCIPLILILTLSGHALALPGDPDTTFSNNGISHHLMGSGSNPLQGTPGSVAIQANGKIVTAGQVSSGTKERFAVARYETTGDLDLSFSGDGKVQTKFGPLSGATSVAIQNNQKIVVAGWKVSGSQTRFALARYKINGHLDLNFGVNGNGKVTTPIGVNSGATSVAIQPDQKIVVTGNARVGGDDGFAVARYQTNGDLDTSFDNDGKVHTPIGVYAYATSAAIQIDGKIVVAGMASTTPSNSRFALARYEPINGGLDTSFGNGGTVTISFPGSPSNAGANSVAIQNDGMIVAAGYSGSGSNSRFALVRYDPVAGSLDTNFDTDGRVITNMGAYSYAASVAIQLGSGGEIVAVGSGIQANNGIFAVVRYDPVAGALDTSFGTGGKVKTLIGNTSYATAVAIQPGDSKLVVAGGTSVANKNRFAVARYDD